MKTYIPKLKTVSLIRKINILLFLTYIFTACTSDFTINDKDKIVIFIPEKANITEKFSAEEMGKLLRQIINNKNIIIQSENEKDSKSEKNIFIGNTTKGKKLTKKISELDIESFIISANSKNLILTGNCERATLYAVYTLLEQLGCRWLAPGIDHIPNKKEILISAGKQIQSPGIQYRILRYLTLSDETDQWKMQCIDWGIKNKINMVSDSEFHPNFPEEIMKRGSVRGINGTHVAGHILNNELYNKYPEVFARDKNGKSILNPNTQQFCFSSEKAVSVYADRIMEYIKLHPEVELLPITQADGLNYCQCENCMKLYSEMSLYGEQKTKDLNINLNVTKAWMKFSGNIAEKINQTYPDKKFYTLAYSATTDPNVMDFQMCNNVIVVLVHSVSLFDQLHTFERGIGKYNYMDFYKKWKKFVPEGIGVYDYYPFSKFRSLPLVAIDKITSDIKSVYNLNCPYFELQSVTSPGMYLPVYYAAAKMMWDPTVDIEKEMSLFYKGMYGSSAGYIEKFFQILEKARETYPYPYKHDSKSTDLADIISYITKDVVQEAGKILEKVKTSVDSGEIIERLQPIFDQFNYAKYLRLGRDAYSSYINTGNILYLEEAVQYAENIKQLAQEVQNSSGIRKNLGIISTSILKTGRNGVGDELERWEKTFIKIKQKENK